MAIGLSGVVRCDIPASVVTCAVRSGLQRGGALGDHLARVTRLCLARAPRSRLSGVVRCNMPAPAGWRAVTSRPQWSRALWDSASVGHGAVVAESRAGASSGGGGCGFPTSSVGLLGEKTPENPAKTVGKRAKTTKSKKNRPLRGRGAGGAPLARAPEGRSAVGAHQRASHHITPPGPHSRGTRDAPPGRLPLPLLPLPLPLPPPLGPWADHDSRRVPPPSPPNTQHPTPNTLPRSPETPASPRKGGATEAREI